MSKDGGDGSFSVPVNASRDGTIFSHTQRSCHPVDAEETLVFSPINRKENTLVALQFLRERGKHTREGCEVELCP